jgi:hypothetical protein
LGLISGKCGKPAQSGGEREWRNVVVGGDAMETVVMIKWYYTAA